MRSPMVKPDSTGHITAEQVAGRRPGGHRPGVRDAGEQRDGRPSSRGGDRRGLKAEAPALLHTDAVQGFLKVPFSAGPGRGPHHPLRPQDRRPQGHRRSVHRPGVKNPGPCSPAAARRAACAPARRPPPRSRALPRRWSCGRRAWRKSCPHGGMQAYALERLLTSPAWSRWAAATPPTFSPCPWRASPARTSSTTWASRASASPPAPPATRASPATWLAALKLPKKDAGGVLRLSFGPETTKEDIDALYEALLRHKNTRFSML